MNERATIQRTVDAAYQSRQPLFRRLLMRLFKKHFNGVAISAITTAYERSQIDSRQMHAIAGTIQDMCFPKRRK